MFNPVTQTHETPEYAKDQFPYVDYGDSPPWWVKAIIVAILPYGVWLEIKDRQLIKNWWRH